MDIATRATVLQFSVEPCYFFESTECRVCGSPGAQMFYGGLVCPSCRVFFIRAVNRRRPYHCFKGGFCQIAPGSKTNCKACRFAKCKKAQMVEESVGRRRKEKDTGLPADSVVPYFAPVMVNLRNAGIGETLSLGYKFADRIVTINHPKQLADQLVAIEGICDNIYGPMPKGMFSNLNASLAEVLKYSQACSERTSVGWHLTTPTESMAELLHLVYCRCVTLIADFISAAPEFHSIDEKDKLKLVSTNFADLGLITMLYNTWLKGVDDGLIFPHGFKFCPTPGAKDEMNGFLRVLISYLHTDVVPIFEKIQLTAQEYTLLKMIILFSGSVLLTDKSAEVAVKAKNKYSKILVDFVNDAFQTWPEALRLARISDLFAIVEKIKVGLWLLWSSRDSADYGNWSLAYFKPRQL